MKVLQEITVWRTSNQPNHIYFMNDSRSKAYAYLQKGTDKVFKFKNPLGMDLRGRRFKEVPNQWNFSVDDQPVGRTWRITGSKGDQYTVVEDAGRWSCTCSGFQFRGKCRHLEQAKMS